MIYVRLWNRAELFQKLKKTVTFCNLDRLMSERVGSSTSDLDQWRKRIVGFDGELSNLEHVAV